MQILKRRHLGVHRLIALGHLIILHEFLGLYRFLGVNGLTLLVILHKKTRIRYRDDRVKGHRFATIVDSSIIADNFRTGSREYLCSQI